MPYGSRFQRNRFHRAGEERFVDAHDGDVTLGILDVVQGETAAAPDGSLYPKPG